MKNRNRPTSPAGEKLLRWLGERGLTPFEFCCEHRLDLSCFYTWIAGTVPSLKNAATIERATGIACIEWAPTRSRKVPPTDPAASAA